MNLLKSRESADIAKDFSTYIERFEKFVCASAVSVPDPDQAAKEVHAFLDQEERRVCQE